MSNGMREEECDRKSAIERVREEEFERNREKVKEERRMVAIFDVDYRIIMSKSHNLKG